VVLFRQRFGDLKAAQDGLLTVGVTARGEVTWVSSSLTPNAALTGTKRLSAVGAYGTLRPYLTLRPLRPLRPHLALGALRPVKAVDAVDASGTLRPLRAYVALVPLLALVAFEHALDGIAHGLYQRRDLRDGDPGLADLHLVLVLALLIPTAHRPTSAYCRSAGGRYVARPAGFGYGPCCPGRCRGYSPLWRGYVKLTQSVKPFPRARLEPKSWGWGCLDPQNRRVDASTRRRCP